MSRFTIKRLNNLRVSFFILMLFLIPQGTNYRAYFFVVIIARIVSFISTNIRKDLFVKISIFLFLLVASSTLFRFAFLVPINLKDITEMGRLFVPLFILLNSNVLKHFTFVNLLNILALILAVDFSISMVEFFFQFTMGSPVYEFAKNNYWAETHWVTYGRSKGITPGPGQHAILGVFFFILYISQLYSKHAKKGFYFICALLSAFVTIASLSRTGIICLVLSFIILSILYLAKASTKQLLKFGIIMTPVIIGITQFVLTYQRRFTRVFALAQSGLSDGSYKAREDSWQIFSDVALDNWEYSFIGWGKTYFGELAKQTDNEYVFVLAFYGIIFFVIFTLILAYSIIKFLARRRKKSATESSIFALILVGIIFAIPSVFFLPVQNLNLFIILTIIVYHESRRNSIALPIFKTRMINE